MRKKTIKFTKLLLISILISSPLFALQTSEKLFECTEIFKERKNELLVEIERIDEQRQALTALKEATEELLSKKERKVTHKEEVVERRLTEISTKEKSIKDMLAKNEEVLKQIKDIKISKISQTFAKMKPAAAANILSDMTADEAITVLGALKPKTVGKILTKMEPKKASELTVILSK